jgi:two-component system, cell cycle sensor histidine kinase and response regulator CckA
MLGSSTAKIIQPVTSVRRTWTNFLENLFYGVISMKADISPEVQALEAQVRKLEAENRALRGHTGPCPDLQREIGVLTRVMETSPAGIVVLDHGGEIIFANPRAEKVLGLQKDDITQRAYNAPEWKITDYKGNPFSLENLPFQIVQKTRQPVNEVQHAIEILGGKRILLSINAAPLIGENDQFEGMVATVEDVTAKIQAEKELQELKTINEDIIENATEGIVVDNVEGILEFVNPALTALVGYEAEELIGQHSHLLVPSDQQNVVEETVERRTQGVSDRYELELLHKDGRRIPVQVSGTPRWDQNGAVFQGTMAIFTDISTRKEIENLIRENEVRFRNLSEATFEAIFISEKGICLEQNAAAEKMFGYSLNEAIGMPGTDWVAPEDRALVRKHMLSGSETPYEVTALRKNGDIFSAEIRAKMTNYQGRTVRVTALRDITDRKSAEAALRESESKFRSIVEASPMGIHMYQLVADDQLIFTGSNPAANVILGMDNQQFIGKTIEAAFPALKDSPVPEMYRRAALIGEPWQTDQIVYEENEIVGAFEVRAFQTSLNRMVAIFLDITERKQAEEALRQSEATLHSIFTAAPTGIGLVSNRKLLQVNDTICEMVGRRRAELINQNARILYPSAAEYEFVGREKYRLISEKGTGTVTTRWQHKNGQVIDVLMSSTPIDPDDLSIGVTFTALDISEQMAMEQKLTQSENMLRQIIDTTPNCVFVKDRSGKYLVANQGMAVLHNTTPEAFVGKYDYEIAQKWFETIDYAEFRKTEQAIIDNKETIFIPEEAFTYPDGTVRWFQTTKFPFEQEDNPDCILVVSTDITERIQAKKLEDAVYRIAQAPSHAASLDELFARVHAIISDVMEASNFYIALYDEVTDLLSFPFFIDDMDVQPESTKLGQGLTEYILRTGKSLLRDRGQHRELEKSGEIELVGTDSPIWLGVPLKIQEQVIGVMAVQHYSDPQAYGPREQRMLEYVSTQVAEAIAHQRTADALLESEARYRAIVEDQTELIVRWQPNGIRTFVNGSYCRFFNSTADALIGANFFDEMHPEERENVQTILKHLNPAADASSYEERTRIPGVGDRWTTWTDRGIFDENDNLIEVQSVGRDITLRKKFENDRESLLLQIQEQAQRVQQIIETVPEGVLLLDADLQLIVTNPAAEKILPALASSGSGEKLTHLGDEPLNEFLTSPPKGFWHALTIASSPPVHFQIIARALEVGTSSGGWVLVIRDVTQQKTIEQYHQQQERLAAVGQLAAGIAHDFNNILGAITLYAQLAAQIEGAPPLVTERMDIIFDQAMQASELVRQILDFSRGSELERSPLDLVPILKEQTHLLQRTLPENIQITFNFGKVFPPQSLTANIDPTRIQQAIMNLAINARDAMPLGGTLKIGLDHLTIAPNAPTPLPEMKSGDWLRITFTDSGEGISADVLPHIFNPFFTTKGPGQGTGLGLAQVYGIITAHDGVISVNTIVGEESTFSIYLPAVPAEKSKQNRLDLTALPQGQYETILVVEDNSAMRGALVEMLTNLRYRLIAVKNGTEALAIIQEAASPGSQTKIDLVLSDVVMPEIGGVALFNQIRTLKPEIKVILMTGHPMQTELEPLKQHGLVGWLPKPPDLNKLAQMIGVALEK